jgi:hypothetical protein
LATSRRFHRPADREHNSKAAGIRNPAALPRPIRAVPKENGSVQVVEPGSPHDDAQQAVSLIPTIEHSAGGCVGKQLRASAGLVVRRAVIIALLDFLILIMVAALIIYLLLR